ncbi:MAG: PfkB family carbohydrate kinase, partial [Bacteroidales bacterium]|nr:PfkB family carbohydrate kinase [Bacteroidales bacterium]
MGKICCIGHITLDKIVTPKFQKHMPGGTAFYYAHAMSRLNDFSRFCLVTSLAESEMKVVDAIRAYGIDVKVLPSAHSVYFENTYNKDMNNRIQRVLAKADPFQKEDLTDIEADFFHLGTLLADDFSTELIQYLSTKGKVSVDAQGYLREVRGQNVYAVDWIDKLKALQYIDILKVNEYEMEVLTGYSDPERAALQLADWGVDEVVVTLGDKGSLIYAEQRFFKIPAYPPRELVDTTGCGDTYMAAYIYCRSQGMSYYGSGCFAAAMSTA